MKKRLLLFALVTSFAFIGFAQDADEEGCKDHPLLTRMSKFRLYSCGSNYNAVPVHFSASQTEDKEGTVTKLGYTFNPASDQDKPPSPLQIIRNYENAILKNGGKKIYSSTGADGFQGATFTMSKDGKVYWVALDNMTPGREDMCDGFELIIIEMEPMKQEIAASEMFEKINKEGSIALYINFETGRSEIKPESQAIVQQIAEMMKANPGLKVSIEGHTDNVGTAAANKTLAEARAKAVLKAVTAQGVEASRISAKGWGQDKPIADNKTEEGKAKNRRVEIVKM